MQRSALVCWPPPQERLQGPQSPGAQLQRDRKSRGVKRQRPEELGLNAELGLCYQEVDHITELPIRESNHRFRPWSALLIFVLKEHCYNVNHQWLPSHTQKKLQIALKRPIIHLLNTSNRLASKLMIHYGAEMLTLIHISMTQPFYASLYFRFLWN